MDTSIEYIKQCDCEEIQTQRTAILDRRKLGGSDPYLFIDRNGDLFWRKPGGYIWLPFQHQLQEMCATDNDLDHSLDENIDAPAKFVAENERLFLKLYASITLEQIWLMIYMWEKHTALWTGTEWDRAHWTEKEKELLETKCG